MSEKNIGMRSAQPDSGGSPEQQTLNVPMNATVYCRDEICGFTTSVILNPITDALTHIVVKEKDAPHTQRMVSIEQVEESTQEFVRLAFPTNELCLRNPFIEVHYLKNPLPQYKYHSDIFYMPPLVIPDDNDITAVRHRSIPLHELAINQGAQVHSADEHKVGRVDEFLVEKESGHITHLILREGHLFGADDVSIPVSEIEKIADDDVYLKLSKKEITDLPTIPVKRRWK